MAYIDELLSRGERILYIGRQHTFVLVSNIITELVLIGVLIAAGIASQAAFANRVVMGQPVGVLVMMMCVVISLAVLFSAFLDYTRWNNEQYVVTDQRVIQVRGIFNKHVSDSSLEKINDVVLNQSWLGRMFDFGDIEIITGSDVGTSYMNRIAHPIQFKRAMMEAKQYFHRGFGYLDPQSIAAYVDEDDKRQAAIPASIESTLQKLAELRDQGLLSQDEFETKKRDLLSRI